MTDTVLLTRDTGDNQRQLWRFFRLGDRLVLDAYEEQSRESKRHKFKKMRFWGRLHGRESTLKVHEVPMSQELKDEAVESFIANLRAKLVVEIQS